MSRFSNPHSVSIVASSPLALAASEMPSRSWLIFDGSTQYGRARPVPGNLATIMGSNDPHGGPWQQEPTPYANKANWNPISKCIEIIGRYHGTPNGPDARYARYHEASHSFTCQYWDSDGFGGITHNFDETTVNEVTGDNWVRENQTNKLCRFASGGNMYASMTPPHTTVPTIPFDSRTVNPAWGPNGIDWWSGSGAITGGGAQGVCLVIVINDDLIYGLDRKSFVARYNPASNTWLSAMEIPNYAADDQMNGRYNTQLVYSRTKNVAALFGGHQSKLKWWRVNADATISGPYPSTIETMLTSSHIHADPITGNFIVNSRFGFYEMNPTNNVWTNLNTGSSTRPAGVNYNSSTNGSPGITMTSLYEHGVVCFLSSNGFGNARMHLYKHG